MLTDVFCKMTHRIGQEAAGSIKERRKRMNISAALKLKGAWEQFTREHPKFPLFLDAIQRKGIEEGTVVGISFTDPEGKTIETNIKVTASDLELFEILKGLK